MSVFSRFGARAQRVWNRGSVLATPGGSRAAARSRRARKRSARARLGRLGGHEALEPRQLLTWVAISVNGQLKIEETAGAQGQQGATGVLKVDPATHHVLLDGTNSGTFEDTGTTLAGNSPNSLTGPITINAEVSFGSQFIIDNANGGFFSDSNAFVDAAGTELNPQTAPPFVPSPTTPTFNYIGSTGAPVAAGFPNLHAPSNSSLLLRGRSDRDDQFTLSNYAQTIGGLNADGSIGPQTGVGSGLSGLMDDAEQAPKTGIALNVYVNFSVVTGNLAVDGEGGSGDLLNLDFPAGASNWRLGTDAAGNQEILGPQTTVNLSYPITTGNFPITLGTVGRTVFSNLSEGVNLGAPGAGTFTGINVDISSTNSPVTVNGGNNITVHEPLAKDVNLFATPGAVPTGIFGSLNSVLPDIAVEGTGAGDNFFVGPAVAPSFSGFLTVARTTSAGVTDPNATGELNPPQSTHLGGDVNIPFVQSIPILVNGAVTTGPSINLLELDGISGNNVFTLHVPQNATELPPTMIFNGSVPGTFVPPKGTFPPPVGDNRLRVIGNPPTADFSGADTIAVGDVIAGASADPIGMEKIQSLAIYGMGGSDTLSNDSTGNKAKGIAPVPAVIIAGNGQATETSLPDGIATTNSTDQVTISTGAGNDVVLGGSNGEYDIKGNDLKLAQSYFFPHQDECGDIFDVGNSTIASGAGSDTVVRGDRPPLNPQNPGDTDTVTGFTGNTAGNMSTVIDTVPVSNPTAYLYEPTPALLAEEKALSTNKAAIEELHNPNLRAPFTTYTAFVGRAYEQYLVGRNGRTGVSVGELEYWDSTGLPLEQVMAALLASSERSRSYFSATTWARGMIQDTLDIDLTAPLQADGTRQILYDSNGNPITDSQGNVLPALMNSLLNTYALPLEFNGADTPALRAQLAQQFLTSPIGRDMLINQMYASFFPGNVTPSLADRQAIQAELAAGTPLNQVAVMLFDSGGNFTNYVVSNNLGEIGYIGGLYRDLLGRPASIGDLTYWSGLRAAGVSNVQVTYDILNSTEHHAIVINADYQQYLLRGVDPLGLAYWEGYLASGGSEEGLVAQIVASNEYYQRSGGTSAGFIRALYRDILARTTPPGQAEVDFWVAALAASPRGPAQARADVVAAFELSDEHRIDTTERLYTQLVGRAPTPSELASALAAFHAGQNQQQVEASILVARQNFPSAVTVAC